MPTTVLFRKEAITKANIDFENAMAWDCDYLIQLAGQFPFAISREHCGIFISHANSFSSSQNAISSINSIRRLITRAQNFPWMEEDVKVSVKSRLQMSIYHNSLASILSDLSSKQFSNARKTCLYFLLHCPIKIKIIIYFIISLIPVIPFSFWKKNTPTSITSWKGYEKYKKWVGDLQNSTSRHRSL